ncbi:hypothetical protein GQ42DRAFT_153040 [Ramicandelaber brevisporus]|nr:hypothetical protein GQ42DRAFT_153040 [Ramicandelaber brevisporus]
MPPGDVSIDLVSGMASALAFVATIGTAPASSGSFKIAVPSDIPPASDYAIRLRDDDGGVAYSPFFAVKAGDGSSAAAAVSVSASAKESKSVSHVKNTATESASKATATHSSTDKTKASDNDEGSDKDKDKDKKTKTPSDTSTGTSAALAGSGTPSMAAIVTAATVVAITQLTLV